MRSAKVQRPLKSDPIYPFAHPCFHHDNKTFILLVSCLECRSDYYVQTVFGPTFT